MTNRPTDAATGLSPLPARQVEEAGTDATHAIAAEFGSITVECAIAAITGNSQGVMRGSAAFLEALFRLWSEQDLDPDAVWNELHARIEMGELCLRLSRAPGRHRPRRVGPWRVATSKLP